MRKGIIIVDCQYDFINGTLPVPNAESKMHKLGYFLHKHDKDYLVKMLTMDWHPLNHCSFKYNGGQWPIHCVQHSKGAAIYEHVLEAVYETSGDNMFLFKGTEPGKEEYSIFDLGLASEAIQNAVKKYKLDKIDICGIAGDVCVLNTLKDGIKILGKDKFTLLEDFSPSIDGGKTLSSFAKSEGIEIA